jgi:hypothetical protein
MFEKLQDILLERWSDYSFTKDRPKALDFILLTNYNLSPSAKTIIFAVSKDRAKGLFLIRIAKTETAKPFLENAHHSLKLLYGDRRISSLKDTFPRSIFVGDLGGYFVQMETFTSGRDLLSMALGNRRDMPYLQKSEDWLTRFHNFTKKIKVLDDENIQKYFRDDINKAKQIFSKELWLVEFLEKFSQSLTNLKGLEIPCVFGHYDFAPKNVKFNGDRIMVIDWEHARTLALPLIDIVHFYLRYYAKVYKKNYLNSFFDVFCQKRNVFLRRSIKRYIQNIAIPQEIIFHLVVQHSILRLIKVIGYRQELLGFFRQLSNGAIPLEKMIEF